MTRPVTYRDVFDNRLGELAKVARGEKPDKGIPSGLRGLWFKRGVSHLVVGDSGEGKSFVKSQVIEGAARAGHRVDVFDLEDPARETADRSLAKLSGMRVAEIQGRVTDRDVRRLAKAVEDEDWPDRIHYYDDVDSSELILDVLAETDAEICVLDYLQLLDGDNLEETLRRLARAVQKWVRPTAAFPKGRTFVALSQVKAGVSERGRLWFTKHHGKGYPDAIAGTMPGPGKSDIAWCGAWGERPKSVTYIWRPGRNGRLYGFDVPDDRMHLIQGKASFGREGTYIVGFDPEHGRLYDL